ncbi:MAG: bifunctional UDP-N-acetylglucosamine diphosphorylase/glucosamine-1-phosphate N-acetyltransferase GlmU, partial [Chloroflexota bacterium]|nr:bifunctional UDP-N-acetylglucosamine diphosphorylase/glucosamine-1-phosphate N-acetyltransferase GlmU [Chloroflexota bacterium]
MRSRLPKVLHPICGRPMLAYVLDAARDATGERPLVVYSPATAQIRDVFADEADFALQDEPRGTGDALRAALAALPEDVEEIVVLSGDVPLIEAAHVEHVMAVRREGAVMALAAFEPLDPTGYGQITIDESGAVRVLEAKDDDQAEGDPTVANAGLYAFDVAWLRRAISRVEPSAVTGEIYLTRLPEIATLDGERVVVARSAGFTWDESLEGVNDREQLARAAQDLRLGPIFEWMRNGVTFEDPSTAAIDTTVQLAEDVTVEPNVTLKGSTRVGRETVIKSGSYIVDSVIGERCTIWASVIEDSVVEDDVRVGPFSHLRPGARIGAGAEIGNFAEIKKARLGPRTKQHHFSYIGDAEVGADVNIGAGTITANYDGRRKHRTRIGDGAFIGSDTI